MTQADNIAARLAAARRPYHLTLGQLIAPISSTRADKPVLNAIHKPHLYAGLNGDLAFDHSAGEVTAADLLAECLAIRNTTLTGPDGQAHEIADNTPLWVSEPEAPSHRAILDLHVYDDEVELVTKDLD